MLDIDPRDSPTVIVDFGLDTYEHAAALIRAVRCGDITVEKLDSLLGNGPALTEAIAASTEAPEEKLVYKTGWDWQHEMEDDDESDTEG
jgi:hypothetical protein